MLQKLRDQTQGFGFKVLVAILIFVLAVFGFGAFNLFVSGEPEVASVNGEAISQTTLVRAAEREQRRLALQLGEQFDPSQIDLGQLQVRVLEQLIGRSLLFQALDDLGMKIDQARVEQSVRENPAFQIDGQYDADAYRRMVQALRYSPQEFLNESRDLLALDQLQNGMSASAFVTEWELTQSARLLNQQRDLAYLAFTADHFSDQVEIEDDAVRLHYEENQRDYQTDESVDVQYVELSALGLLDDPSIEVSDEEVRAAYEAEAEVSMSGDQRESRHILLQVTEERSAADARTLLEKLKARVTAGEDFGDLAREYSEDPGSAPQGGALGIVGKGVFDPAFEAALWSLQPGELSDPVETEFGVHLIELQNVVVNEFPPFEEMRDEIERRLKLAQAETLFLERIRELDSLAFEQPDTLEGIASAMSLEIQTVNGITASAGAGVFANAELRAAAFTTDVLVNEFNSPAVELTDNRAVVLRVVERHDPQPIPFEEVADAIREELENEQAKALVDANYTEALKRVRAGEAVSRVAADYGLKWQTHALANRNEPDVPPAVARVAFELPRPAEGNKSVGEALLPEGGRAVVTLTRVKDGDIVVMSEREIDEMRTFLNNRAANLDFTAFYATLESEASIDRAL